jgi:hypothetical protein
MFEDQTRTQLIKHLPAWLILSVIVMMLLPPLINGMSHIAQSTVNAGKTWIEDRIESFSSLPIESQLQTGVIAPLFTPQVQRWAGDIARWAAAHELDPNLLATVMQIESCGHPTVSSVAGAQGLFQVMPFHFGMNEDQLDPETNADRGAAYLNSCLGWANGDAGRAMACYNGGPSVLQKPFESWHSETQRYYRWGTGIYADTSQNRASSATLDQWLNAGGASLCQRASTVLGLN